MSRVLGVFAKQPIPGQVKTRLAADTSPEFAVAVAVAFLHDTLARLASLDAHKVVVFAPEAASPSFEDLAARHGMQARPQGEGDLGDRLERFFASAFADGAAAVVVIGSDSPTLPATFLADAFDALTTADVVLGPATDGGYYLIGCRSPVPGLFRDIAWSQPTVLEQTTARIPGRLALLPPWYDVDTLDDWHFLRGHIAAQRRAGLDPQVPATETLIMSEPSSLATTLTK